MYYLRHARAARNQHRVEAHRYAAEVHRQLIT